MWLKCAASLGVATRLIPRADLRNTSPSLCQHSKSSQPSSRRACICTCTAPRSLLAITFSRMLLSVVLPVMVASTVGLVRPIQGDGFTPACLGVSITSRCTLFGIKRTGKGCAGLCAAQHTKLPTQHETGISLQSGVSLRALLVVLPGTSCMHVSCVVCTPRRMPQPKCICNEVAPSHSSD